MYVTLRKKIKAKWNFNLSISNFPKKIKEIIKMFWHFWFFTGYHHPFFFFLDFTFYKVALIFHYIHTLMFKHVNIGKHIWIHTSKMKKKHTHFKISSRDEVFTRLFFFFSSRSEISSWQKRVNSKRHFTIDRDDFILGSNFTCKHPLTVLVKLSVS